MRNFLLLIIGFLPLLLAAQTPTRETVKANLEQLAAGFPKEKVYVQFDKPVYTPGETIWYKAYIMTGSSVSNISTNLYVDYSDADGKILSHGIVPVIQASAKGSFDLPEKFTGKSIHVRVYTKWMLNFDSAFLFDKDIRILQVKEAATKITAPVIVPELDFFPEGGDCILGLSSKVAFKAVYNNGKPFSVQGSIVNNKGETVTSFKTVHDGMGFFLLEPHANEKYTAKWKDEQGKAYETPLPVAKNTGVTLELKISEGVRGFVVKKAPDAAANFSRLNVIATMDQQLVYMATVNLTETQMIGGAIPVAELPSGILQVTLFDSNWVAVAERISFINNDDYHFEPEVGFAALGTGKRGKNVLVINVPDSMESNLSVAVTDAGIGIDSSDNIVSRLMLTGDLKGKVYKPYYYFTDRSDSLQQQLDLVMLTNGWRSIQWENVVNGKIPTLKFPNDTSYLTLAGKVFGTSATEMRQSAMLFLILDHPKDTTRNALQVPIDKNGNFSEKEIVMFDTTKIYYQFVGNKDLANSAEVTFNNGMLPSPGKINFDKNNSRYFLDSAADNRYRFFADQQARLAKLMEGNTLATVTVKARTKSPTEILDAKYASGLFTGGQANEFDVENDVSARAAMNVLTYLQGRVAGLQIAGASSSGQPSVTWRGGTPTFFLNEMQVDVTQLSNMSMSDIGYVKVFQPPFFGAVGGGANGAIAVYTKKGGSNNAPQGKGLPFKVVIGYAPEKRFYSPNYGTFEQRNEQEDLRSTLYWNPMILTTSQNHIVRLTFYNNDISNSFRVIVEGVSKDGRMTHIEKLIE